MELNEYNNELAVLKENIGFTDIIGNANLRKKDNSVYVFDTEKGSFDIRVHNKVDSFMQQHKAILSVLQNSLSI